jgi:hypothetical protein
MSRLGWQREWTRCAVPSETAVRPHDSREAPWRSVPGGICHERAPLVLGIPRSGVPVAFEVARALRAPLDVFLLGKLGVPDHEELVFGAIASGAVRVLDRRCRSRGRWRNPGSATGRATERQ